MRAVTQLTDFSPLAFGFQEQQKNCSLSVCEAVDPRDISALKSLLKSLDTWGAMAEISGALLLQGMSELNQLL